MRAAAMRGEKETAPTESLSISSSSLIPPPSSLPFCSTPSRLSTEKQWHDVSNVLTAYSCAGSVGFEEKLIAFNSQRSAISFLKSQLWDFKSLLTAYCSLLTLFSPSSLNG
jgi:hypothetical protein